MTTFKDLLNAHSDADLMTTLFALYPDQVENRPGYEEVLFELRILQPQTPDYAILVEQVLAEDDDLSEEDWVDVSGVKENDTMTYAIEYEPFEKWLGAEIAPESFIEFDEVHIAAHCLFEMTWPGYSNAERQSAFDAVMDIYADAKEQMDRKMLN